MSQPDVFTKRAFTLQAILAEVWKSILEASSRAVPMALCFSVSIPLSYALALDIFPDYPWLPLSTKTDPIAVMHEAFTVYAGFWMFSFLFYFIGIIYREAGFLGDSLEEDFILLIKSNPPPEKLRRVTSFIYAVFAIPSILAGLVLWSSGEIVLGVLMSTALMITGVLGVRMTIYKAKRQGDNHESA